jgi:hypothetical protein
VIRSRGATASGRGRSVSSLDSPVATADALLRRQLLEGAAVLAMPVLAPETAKTPSNPAALVHGLYWLVANLAEVAPRDDPEGCRLPRGRRKRDRVPGRVTPGSCMGRPGFGAGKDLVELGAAKRRANKRLAAQEPLRAGLGLAHRCGAERLAARAEEELKASGACPRRRGCLPAQTR